MSGLKLTLKHNDLPVPLEAEVISPDVLSKLSRQEIGALKIFLGKRECRLDEFFDVEGDPGPAIELAGDLSRVKWIGRGMVGGSIRIEGNAGMHLGAYMSGGRIDVSGDVSDWLGGEMTGGFIHVRGNAGGQIGAAYRGSPVGMRDGTILVEGAAGNEVGMSMKGGIIAIRGAVRDFTGLKMKSGSIFLLGGAGIRTGAWMERGTIVALQSIALLPTFLFACSYVPVFLRSYFLHLQKLGFPVPAPAWDGTTFQRYSGDFSIIGRGEILIAQAAT